MFQPSDPANQGQMGQATTSPPSTDAGQVQGPHSQDAGQTTTSPQPTDEVPTFFDPSSLSPELQVPYKQMHAAFTKKSQEIAAQRRENEALINAGRILHNFQQNPSSPEMAEYLARFGYMPTHNQGPQRAQITEDWQPESWTQLRSTIGDDVKAEAKKELLQELAPWLQQTQDIQVKAYEKALTDIDPKWRDYEGTMMQLLQELPGLSKYPDRLYRLAVPPEVLEAKATQIALDKFQKQGRHAAVDHRTSTPRTKDAPKKAASIHEAFHQAKEQLAKEGY